MIQVDEKRINEDLKKAQEKRKDEPVYVGMITKIQWTCRACHKTNSHVVHVESKPERVMCCYCSKIFKTK